MTGTRTPAAATPPRRPLPWTLGCAAALLTVTLSVAAAPGGPAPAAAAPPETMMTSFDLQAIERPRILAKAGRYLGQAPETVTATRCERSAGGPHDFYSEGDYWWPDPENPGGPYIWRDGLTNPDNFVAHRHAMIRLSEIVATLASAYRLTGDDRYAADAARHLDAWFVSPRTRMNPSLHYAQAIQGRHTGRSIGLIDTLHLIEVARGARIVLASPAVDPRVADGVVEWFRTYLRWMNEHEYGQAERDHPNNHGVCWSLQAAAFARLTGDDRQLAWVRDRYTPRTGSANASQSTASPRCVSNAAVRGPQRSWPA